MLLGALLAGFLAPAACRQPPRRQKGHGKTSARTQARETAPPDTSRPVARYAANQEDAVTNNDFVVTIYPTLEPRVFTARISYGANEVRQDITMLPKSYYREITLKKGPGEGQCIFGFTDADGKFNEMKLISGSPTSIGIKTLKEYYLSNP